MMSKGKWLVLTCVMVVLSCETDKNVSPDFKNYFVKYYGLDGNQVAVDMYTDPTEDAVYILGSSQPNTTTSDIYLAKVNFEGALIWEKTLGSGHEHPRDIEMGFDGNFVILSNTEVSPGSAEKQIKLLRVTRDGDFVDEVVFTGYPDQQGFRVTPISDGGYIVGGNVPDDTPDQTQNVTLTSDIEDIITIRFDSNLDVMATWANKPTGAQIEGAAVKVFEKDLQNFYMFGYSDEPIGAPLNLNFYVVGLNETAGFKGRFASGSDVDFERTSYVLQAPPSLNNVFFMLGTVVNQAGEVGLYFVKVFPDLDFSGLTSNISGTPRTIISQDMQLEGVAACASEQNIPGFIIVGSKTGTEVPRDIWLGKVNLDGKLLWSRTFGFHGNDDTGSQVLELPNGRIFLLCTIELGGQKKISLIKLNSNGELSN